MLIRKIIKKQIHCETVFFTNREKGRCRLRNADHLVVQFPRTKKFGTINIKFEGARIYNKIPKHVKESNTMSIFKTNLKTYIVNNIPIIQT